MDEKISVIIPTIGRWNLLTKAIKSVINQTYKNLEIIIVNDCLIEIPKNILNLDNRIVAIDDKETSCVILGFPSGGYSRNKGIKASSGNYLAFLDEDDQFLPEKIEIQIKDLKKYTNINASATDAYISIFSNKVFYKKIHSNYYYKIISKKLEEVGLNELPPILNSKHLEVHNFIITSSVMIRKQELIKIGYFNNIANGGTRLKSGEFIFEDWDLWKRLSYETDFRYLKIPLSLYKRGSIRKLLKKIKLIILNKKLI